MEKRIQMVGTILLDKTNMPNSSDNMGSGADGKQANSGDRTFSDTNDNHVLSYLSKITFQSLDKGQSMATKIGFIIFQFIGFPVYIYSWLNAIWTGDEVKQWVLFLFGVIFAVIEGLRRYENFRSKRLDNEERIYDIKRAHRKLEKQDRKEEEQGI